MHNTVRLKQRFSALVIGFLLVLAAMNVSAASIPAYPEGYVNDYAHLLTPSQSQHLTQFLHRFEQKTSDQVVVATFNSLQGQPLEDFSIKLADKWKIGQKGRDNGVILLIFKNDKRLRIEVGYGLEGVLTDATSGLIIRHNISPYFKKGQYYDGINSGLTAITQAIKGKYTAPTNTDDDYPLSPTQTLLIVIAVALFLIYLIISLLGNAIISLQHKRSTSNITSTHPWFGPHHFFCITFTNLYVFLFINDSLSSNTGSNDGGLLGGGFSGGGGGFGGGGASGGW